MNAMEPARSNVQETERPVGRTQDYIAAALPVDYPDTAL